MIQFISFIFIAINCKILKRLLNRMIFFTILKKIFLKCIVNFCFLSTIFLYIYYILYIFCFPIFLNINETFNEKIK